MISPKYSTTHYFYPAAELASAKVAPHTVNLYLDYNCRFSARLFIKLKESVIPKLNEKYPNKFQFIFVNVVQPWHPNSVLLNEFSVVVANLLRDPKVENSNALFWDFSNLIFQNSEKFFDEALADLNRNEIYKYIANFPGFDKLGLPFDKSKILDQLIIPVDKENATNKGNGASVDLKYFTKYLRGVGVHVTPTVSVDGIINNSVSSGDDIDTLVKVFGDSL